MVLNRKILFLLLMVLVLSTASIAIFSLASTQTTLWQELPDPINRSTGSLIRYVGERPITLTSYRLVDADFPQLQEILLESPTSSDNQAGVTMAIPLPDGSFSRFTLSNSPIMEPDLAAKYPELQTFAMKGLDDPTATGRADLTPAGFHAYIQTAAGEIYVDPYQSNDPTRYISYNKADFAKPNGHFVELAPPNQGEFQPELQRTLAANLSVGETLREYQLALSATGEYVDFICSLGGDCSTTEAKRATAMAALVTGINRINEIYEREVAIRFVLIDKTDELVFTNKDSDPYTSFSYGNEPIVLWFEVSSAIDASSIEISDYDLGHVVGVGGGGIASPFNCSATTHEDKAKAATALTSPIGDPFWVDYTAHEIGHQFTASHSYNAFADRCIERVDATALEPGSGTTLMSYAGLCGGQDMQNNVNAMFNAGAFNEIMTFVTAGNGASCADQTVTGNTPPAVDAGGDFTIPRDTPFSLTAAITDAEQSDEALTISWEQFSVGAAWEFGNILPNTDQQDSQSRPILRVNLPTTDRTRLIPSLPSILDGTYANEGEDLPTIDQTLTFRATGRDNAINGGGVASDDMQLTVVSNAGPFRITSQALPALLILGSSTEVTWDVANTTAAPISCSLVNIRLSVDNGKSWDTTLAEDSLNDGSEMITLPTEPIKNGRIRVECADNIFFDISKGKLATADKILDIYLPLASN